MCSAKFAGAVRRSGCPAMAQLNDEPHEGQQAVTDENDASRRAGQSERHHRRSANSMKRRLACRRLAGLRGQRSRCIRPDRGLHRCGRQQGRRAGWFRRCPRRKWLERRDLTLVHCAIIGCQSRHCGGRFTLALALRGGEVSNPARFGRAGSPTACAGPRRFPLRLFWSRAPARRFKAGK